VVDLVGEVQDREAVLLALVGAAAAYAVARDGRLVLTVALGVLVVRAGAGLLLHGTHKIPFGSLPDLTDNESAVATFIYAGYGDPAIAARLGITVKRVEGRSQRIQAKWRVSTRSEIAHHVAQIRGEPPPERPTPLKQRWELVAEVGTGVAVMALGVAILAVPPDTPLIGDWRDWFGLSVLVAGLLFSAVSLVMFFWERGQSRGEH
jgi:DNA-binding CsgD family transcriptional regulator